MISLSSLSRTPIYQQIIEQILAQIACGALVPDQQLPGVRLNWKGLTHIAC